VDSLQPCFDALDKPDPRMRVSPYYQLDTANLCADGVTLNPSAETAYRAHLIQLVPEMISYFVSRTKRLSGQMIDLTDKDMAPNRTWVPGTPIAPPLESPNSSWVLPENYSTPVLPQPIRSGVSC
jgi:hypothetical protein